MKNSILPLCEKDGCAELAEVHFMKGSFCHEHWPRNPYIPRRKESVDSRTSGDGKGAVDV